MIVASRQGGPDTDGVSATDSHGVSLTNAPAGPTAPSERGTAPSERGTTSPEGGQPEAASLPTRDPAAYAQTDHFRERLHQTGRYVSLPLVSHTIREGQLRYNSTDGWRFATVVEGVRVVVVVSDTGTDSPVLVTGWTEIADRETALSGDCWSSVDVETITLRAALSADKERQLPGRIRPRVIARPFEIADHRVSTDAGEGFLTCHDCGGRFRSKRALTEKACGSRR